MIKYKDFVPKKLDGIWYMGESYEDFNEVVAAANSWLENEKIKSIQIETVILPNVDTSDKESTSDASIQMLSNVASWHQFLRIWY